MIEFCYLRNRRIKQYLLLPISILLLVTSAAFCDAGTWAYSFTGGSASPNQQISNPGGGSYSISGHSPDPAMQYSTATGPTRVTCTYSPSSGESPVLAVVA